MTKQPAGCFFIAQIRHQERYGVNAMPDNEFLIKITGDATGIKDAAAVAKEQIDKASKSVEMLADLVGIKVPDALKKMIASSELVGPALAEAFGPLSLLIFGIEILQRVAEKMEQMDEEAEKHRLAWQDIGIASDDATRKIEDGIEKQEQKYVEITQGPIAGMEFALGHMRSVALSAFADIAGAMDRVAAELTEESSWFNVNKEAAADIKATIGDMHKAMDDAAKAAPKDPFAPIIAQEKVLNDKIKETNDLIRRRSANMGADKSLVDPLKQEVALYEDILSKLRLQKDLQAEALKTAKAEINKAKTDRSVTIDIAKIEAHKKTNDAIIQQEEETIRELAAAHQISAEEELSLNKTVLDQKFTQDETALSKKLEQLKRDRNRNAAEIITVQGEIKALTTQHYTELEKLNADYYKQVDHNGQEAVNKAAAKMHALLQQIKESQQIILESAKEHDQAMGQIADQRLNFELQIGKISQTNYEKQLQWEMAETYANERAKLEAKRQAAEGNLVEQAKVDAELKKLDDKYRAESEKAEQQSLLRRRQQFDQYFKQVSSSFNTALNGWMQGTETASQAFDKMFQDILSQLVNFVEQWIEKKIEMWLMDKLLSQTSQSASAEAQIVSNAAVAYSGAYAATAAIPIVGPGLAPEAAMMAYMDVMAITPAGFALGGIVPATGLALVHEGEKILPKSMSGNGSGLGGITVVVNHSVNAVDAASFQEHIRRHSNMIANEVTRALKRKGVR
jgi:hypothetical protein